MAHVAARATVWPANEKRPRIAASGAKRATVGRRGYLALANLPRSVLVNRDSLPFLLISRRMDE